MVTMTSIRRFRGLECAIPVLILTLCGYTVAFGGDVFPRDRILLPFVPAAAVEGPAALRFNPAGLGFQDGVGLNYYHTYSDSSVHGDDGLFFSFKGLGLSVEWLGAGAVPDGHSYTVGFATGQDAAFSVGTSYQWRTSDDPIQDKSHFWDYGLTWRPADMISLAAAVDNYNRMKIAGARTDAEFTYSAALNFLDGRLILGGDWYQSTSQRVKDGTYRVAVSFEVADGFTVCGDMDEHDNYYLGGRVNLANLFVGSQSRFHRDDGYRGGVFYAGLNEARQKPVVRVPREMVKMRLTGDIPDRPPDRVLLGPTPMTTFDWVQLLDKAAIDPMVSAVILTIDHPDLGGARAEEIRRAIERVRDAGKYVAVYLDGMVTNREYFLATAADQIIVPPVSSVDLLGLRAEVTFVKRLLDKIGVQADLEHIGDYKSASDLATRTEMSDAHREALNRLLDDLDGYWTEEMALGRGTTVDRVREWIAHGPYVSVEAQEAGMVDAVAHPDEVDRIVRDAVGHLMVSISQQKFVKRSYYKTEWGKQPSVAVVFAEGTMMEGEDSESGLFGKVMGSRTISSAMRAAREDKNVKAIVLRVNSGGGSVFASDDIWREVSRTAGQKPIIVSFGDVAASGGYYIACAADSVFAMPNTITGSIGIISGKLVLEGLYDKLGLDKEVVTRGRYANLYGMDRPFDDDERAVVKYQMGRAYERFVDHVAEGRSLSPDSVDAIGQGRVWSGVAARDIGLIDRYADLSESIIVAARMAGIKSGTTIRVEQLPKRQWKLVDSRWLGPAAGLPGVQSLAEGLRYALGQTGRNDENLWYEMPQLIVVR